MSMRNRLVRGFTAVAVLTIVLVLAGVNVGMLWSMGHMMTGAGHHMGDMLGGGSPMGALLRWSLGAGLVSVATAMLLGRYVANRVAEPLAALARATGEFRLRDLGYRVQVPQADDEVAHLARSFNAMAERLQKEDEIRRQLLADVAHELRHPVTAIQGQIELLQDGVRQPTAENLSAIADEALRLGRLIGDLRDLSLAEAGALSLNRERLTAEQILGPLAANFEPVAAARGVALHVSVADDAPQVIGDPLRLRQVLNNLVSNAIRHTPAGGRVEVTAGRRDGCLKLVVADTGTGIAPEDLPHIFERFYRADPSRSRQSGGTGLGLAIARSFVLLHGGQIQPESAPGKGARFTVLLPAATN